MSARERALEARVIQLVGDVGTLTAEKGALEARLRRVEALADAADIDAACQEDEDPIVSTFALRAALAGEDA